MVSPRYRRLLPFLLVLALLLLFGLPWLLLLRAENQELDLRVSTGQPGGVYHPLANAIAGHISRDHPRLRFQLTPSNGSVMSMRRLENGETDLALLQNGTPGPDNIRVIAPLYDEVLHILVPLRSGTQRLADLRGKRLAIGPEDSGTQQVVERLFEHYGIGAGSFDPVATDMSSACQMLTTGEIDAVFVVAGIHATAITDAMAGGQVRLIGIGTAGEAGGEIDGLRLQFPNIEPFVIPKSTYRASDTFSGRPLAPVQTLSVPSLLVCRAALPERAANQITRSIFTNRADLIRQHPTAGSLQEPEDNTRYSYPLHLGAEDYYRRHEPSFLVTYAEVMALILTIAISVWGGLAAFRKWLQMKKKDRIDEYYVQIEEILTRLQDDTDLTAEQLAEMEQTLSGLRHQAVQQLVAEKLLANESFRIFQVLLANSQNEVRRRIASL